MEQISGWNVKKTETQADQSPKRIISLSDGVFAIVMTLLILDIRVTPAQEITSNEALLNHLLTLLPRIESFVFSFLVLGIFWMIHHLQFKYIHSSDRNLIWINIAFFMFITFIPFSMHLAGSYGHFTAASVIFSINLLLVSLSLYANWRYATNCRRLVDPDLDQRIVDFGLNRNYMLLFTACLSIVLAFVSPHLSYAAYLLYPALQLFDRK